jgi:uncharacterized LabA/DUF88 family protein
MVKTIVYVDGFNLYYGCLKNTPYKWVNLKTLAASLLKPENDIVGVKYFTAHVKARPKDPQQPIRQQTYLRALKTLPETTVVLGHFLSKKERMVRADGQGTVEVIRTDEKGSDVNLATHLLMDAFWNRFDLAVLITNDSDLVEPVRQVRAAFKKKVGILNPQSIQSVQLKKEATFFYQIQPGHLKGSQFPPTLTDQYGTITKPASW